MSTSDKNNLRLQQYLPYRMWVTYNTVSKLIAGDFEEQFGIPMSQWRLLATLVEEGPLTQNLLCSRTMMDKVNVQRAAQGLLQQKLIRRLPNSEDGRSHRLLLTKVGERLYHRMALLALKYEVELVAGIDRHEIAQFERMLRRLEQSAKAIIAGRASARDV
jgi:DNA-binding MarR family transcriptional regulator